MARPKRTDRQLFYDEFADMELSDQVAALEILTEINRQARRGKLRKTEQIETHPLEEMTR